MNPKKLNPSEADLRQSILERALKLIEGPTQEDLKKEGWFTSSDITANSKYTDDTVLIRLKKQAKLGILECKKLQCKFGKSVQYSYFFRFKDNEDEITRAY
jgi:hypothetical protein